MNRRHKRKYLAQRISPSHNSASGQPLRPAEIAGARGTDAHHARQHAESRLSSRLGGRVTLARIPTGYTNSAIGSLEDDQLSTAIVRRLLCAVQSAATAPLPCAHEKGDAEASPCRLRADRALSCGSCRPACSWRSTASWRAAWPRPLRWHARTGCGGCP